MDQALRFGRNSAIGLCSCPAEPAGARRRPVLLDDNSLSADTSPNISAILLQRSRSAPPGWIRTGGQRIRRLRVLNKAGTTPPNLRDSDFTLFVNGTIRPARLRVSHSSDEPVVTPGSPSRLSAERSRRSPHRRQAGRTIFRATARRILCRGMSESSTPTKRLFPFTRDRAELLRNLEEVEHARQGLQFQLPRGQDACTKMEVGLTRPRRRSS